MAPAAEITERVRDVIAASGREADDVIHATVAFIAYGDTRPLAAMGILAAPVPAATTRIDALPDRRVTELLRATAHCAGAHEMFRRTVGAQADALRAALADVWRAIKASFNWPGNG